MFSVNFNTCWFNIHSHELENAFQNLTTNLKFWERKDEKNIMGKVNVNHNKNVSSNLSNKICMYTHIWCDHIKQRYVHLQVMNTQYLEVSGLKGLYNDIYYIFFHIINLTSKEYVIYSKISKMKSQKSCLN